MDFVVSGVSSKSGPGRNLAEILACPEAASSYFEPEKLSGNLFNRKVLF
jgi:hypothetical protein